MKTLSEEEIQVEIENAVGLSVQSLSDLVVNLQHELRQIAHRQRRDRGSETLSTTALVNEAYIKLSTSPQLFARIDKKHFLAIAARAMRHIIVNYARDKVAQKRGAGARYETFDEGRLGQRGEDLAEAGHILELNDALQHLERIRPRLAQVVQLRYFAGLSEAEAGEVLDLDASTIRRDWVKARGWLYEQLNPDQGKA